jgi:hypothetical protein
MMHLTTTNDNPATWQQELMQGGTLRRLVMRQMLQNPTAIYSDAAGLDICLQVGDTWTCHGRRPSRHAASHRSAPPQPSII